MESASPLTADPLGLRAPALPGRALARLDRIAATTFALRHAEPALAPLTCPRLTLLLDPPRGDEALAAALARCALQGEDGPVAWDRAPRLGTPERHARIEERRRTTPPAPRGRRPAATPQRRGPASPAPLANPLPSRAAAAAKVAAPARATDAAAAPELLPFAERIVGGLTAAASPLPAKRTLFAADPAVDGRGGREALATPDGFSTPWRQESPWPAPILTPAPLAPGPEHASTRARSAPTLSGTTAGTRAKAPTTERGLRALVHAWTEGGPSEEPAPGMEAAAATAASTADRAPQPAVLAASRTLAAPLAASVSQPRGEPADVGDALGRMLVAELRRYGIEVDAG